MEHISGPVDRVMDKIERARAGHARCRKALARLIRECGGQAGPGAVSGAARSGVPGQEAAVTEGRAMDTNDSLRRLVCELDGSRLGRFGFDKCTTGARPVLTVYDVGNCGDGTDEQLTFTPLELLGFCREVIRIADASVSIPGGEPGYAPSECSQGDRKCQD
jgi:hypothetical protein